MLRPLYLSKSNVIPLCFQATKRSPTPLTQLEETNENEDEIQVTIEAPPAQTNPGKTLQE